jgi:hypothetical protein
MIAQGLRERAIIAVLPRLCAMPVRGGAAHRWALIGRIHAGGDVAVRQADTPELSL